MNEERDQNKNNTKKVVFIVLAVIALLVAIWFLFLRNYLSDRFNISPDNLFPFGNPSNRIPPDDTSTSTPPSGGGITEDVFQPLYRDRLRLVTDQKIAGFVPRSTNLSYPSQSSLAIYNNARGSENLDYLDVVRVPNLRYVVQTNHDVVDVTLDTNVTSLRVGETFVPNVYETLFDASGQYLTTRLYDPITGFIETFTSQIIDLDMPLVCEEPLGRDFNYGNSHPSIAAVKNMLDELYDYNLSSDDVFDESLASALQDFQTNLDLPSTVSETVASSTLDAETTSRLYEVCLDRKGTEDQRLPVSLSGSFLNANIDMVSHNPDGYELALLQQESVGGVYQLTSYHTLFDREATLFESRFGEWLLQWVNDDSIMLQTKPSQLIDGYVYLLDTRTGRMDKIIGDKAGLLALISPDGTKAIYSATDNNTGTTEFFLLDLTTREEYEMPFRTLPDKCTWRPDSTTAYCGAPTDGLVRGEPDLWFQGKTQYSDSIWSIDAATGQARLIYNIEDNSLQELDVYKMQYDPFEGNYLYFLDKNTNYLWSLEIDGLDE